MNAKNPKSLQRSLTVAAALLIGTVAMASGHRAFPRFGQGASAPVQGPEIVPVSSKEGAVTVSARLDRKNVLAGSDGTVRMELTLAGENRDSTANTSVPTDLIVVMDRSGSMSGEKIEQARRATSELIAQLGTQDRFALVTYESGVRLEIPLAPATEEIRERWQGIVESIGTAGGTNMSGGLDLAHSHLLSHRDTNRASRVILISDGQANEGDSSPAGLRQRGLNAARSEYVLSTIGVGLGFNEELMTSLANVGTGNFYFLEGGTTMAGVFKNEFDSARETVASGVIVRLAPPAGVSVEDAAGYPLERNGTEVSFRPGALFSGQQRKIWVRYRVPTKGDEEIALGTITAEFRDRGERYQASVDGLPTLALVKNDEQFHAGIDKDVWGAGIAVDEYNALRLKVSSAIQRGDRKGAEQEIQSYRAKSEALNVAVGSAEVARSVEATRDLEEDVADAFSGPQQAQKRNVMSKKLQASGFDGRRLGAKK